MSSEQSDPPEPEDPAEPDPDVVVLREGTEGLSTVPYAADLADRLSDATVRRARTPRAERELVATAPVVTGVGIDEPLLDAAGELELFACAFAGTDHLPMERLRDQGVAVTNASGIHAPGIAEQAIGSLLAFTRRLHEGWRRQRRREWRHYQSGELAGSTVTVVGLGAIGRAVVERLEGFDVDTIGIRADPDRGGPTDVVYGPGRHERHDAFARSDAVVLACPLTAETRGLVGAAELATLPPHATVVNVARGELIDTDALLASLQSGAIRGAALDVSDPEPLPPDHPLWRLENCLITPHVGGHTPEHWPRLAAIVARNVRHLAAGGDPAELENLAFAP